MGLSGGRLTLSELSNRERFEQRRPLGLVDQVGELNPTGNSASQSRQYCDLNKEKNIRYRAPISFPESIETNNLQPEQEHGSTLMMRVFHKK